ncbi:MAG TPA: hypothetical protein VM492_10670, partial [Sumerlaeia bacterium]|nr:hypothetical protein [Sumerlaeia bacterium]
GTGEAVRFFFFIGRILLQEFSESFPESFIESIPAEDDESVGNSPHHGFNNPPSDAHPDWLAIVESNQDAFSGF